MLIIKEKRQFSWWFWNIIVILRLEMDKRQFIPNYII